MTSRIVLYRAVCNDRANFCYEVFAGCEDHPKEKGVAEDDEGLVARLLSCGHIDTITTIHAPEYDAKTGEYRFPLHHDVFNSLIKAYKSSCTKPE